MGDVSLRHFRSKAPLERILPNVRLCMRTQGNPFGVTWLPVALLVMRSDTFCTTTTLVRKKCGNALPGMRRTYFRLLRHFRSGQLPGTWFLVRNSSGHVTSVSTHRIPANVTWAVPIYYLSRTFYMMKTKISSPTHSDAFSIKRIHPGFVHRFHIVNMQW